MPNSLVLQTIKKDNLTIKEALIKLDQENVSQALIDLNQGALEKSALDGSREAFIYLASTSTSFDNNNPINTLNSDLLAMYNVKEIQEKLNILKNFTDISNNSELKKLHTDALKLTKNSRKKLQERMK